MDREEFERLVVEAVDELPAEFRARLENVEVVVEDNPEADLLRGMGMNPRRDTLYGVYQGIPLAQRGFGFANHLPDRITIFFRPLVRDFRIPGRIRREIRRTIIHEVGHLLGLDEQAIRREGY